MASSIIGSPGFIPAKGGDPRGGEGYREGPPNAISTPHLIAFGWYPAHAAFAPKFSLFSVSGTVSEFLPEALAPQ